MDTSAAGRERVRQELRQANEEWDLFTNHLQDAERLVDAFFIKWSSFNDDLVSLSRWISDKEAALRSEGDLCATLLEKRNQLQHYRVCCCLLTVLSLANYLLPLTFLCI